MAHLITRLTKGQNLKEAQQSFNIENYPATVTIKDLNGEEEDDDDNKPNICSRLSRCFIQ